jgi:hypothetical protein
MQQGTVTWQISVLLAAVLVVGWKVWRGWRAGVARELINLMALACAYLMAVFGGRMLAPLLRPFGIPDGLLGIAGGALLGVTVFLAITISGAILFKKTSQQSVAAVRFGYGLAGAAIGGVMGLFIVWIAILGIRLLGTVAETRIEAAKHPVRSIRGKLTPTPIPQEPSRWVRNLANIKHALEQGAAGAVVEQVDPIPGTLYSLLSRVGQMISNEQSIDRFLAFPGVKTLTEHPKIAALQKDPDIARDLIAGNYLALVRNDRIIRAANDEEIAELMSKFEFEKALDYALRKSDRQPPTPPGSP